MPNAALPRPTAPVPALAAPAAPSLDRPVPPPTAFAAPSMPITPFEAFRSGARALRDGQKEKALVSLEYAADQGVVAAQWKLGRMYAEGQGVPRSDIKAFEFFSRIADNHADDNPAHAAGALCLQRVRRARPLLRNGHSGFRREGRCRPRASHVRLCGLLLRRCRRRNIISARMMLDNGPFHDPQAGGALALFGGEQGPVSGARRCSAGMLFRGEAWHPAAAGARPDVADARAFQCDAVRRLDRANFTTRR